MLPELPLPYSAADFRDSAVRASQAAISAARHSPSVDALNAGISYCLPADNVNPSFRKRLQIQVAGGFSLAFLLMFSTLGALSAPFKHLFPKDSPLPLAIAAAVGFSGFFLLFYGVFAEHRAARRTLKQRHPHLFAQGHPAPRIVRIENAHTYNKPKIIADDFVLVLPHPASSCVQLEGLLHRYLIYAPDAQPLLLHRGGMNEAVRLSYAPAGQPLDLMLIGYTPGLYSALQSALLQPMAPPIASPPS